MSGPLSDAHRVMLEQESGINPEVIEARGYRTVTTKAELDRLGFGRAQQLVPALLVPLYNPSGEISLHQIRPDAPRTSKKSGKIVKYETPGGEKMALDTHPSIRHLLKDLSTPLFITEGMKKADALVSRGCCTVGLIGVWNFRGKNESGGKAMLPEWEQIALNDGRKVYIVFDSDVMEKRSVYMALERLVSWLRSRGASVKVIYLSTADAAKKQGVDDYLADSHSIDDLLTLSTSELKKSPKAHDDEVDELKVWPYAIRRNTLNLMKEEKTGPDEGITTYTPLCNFRAQIVEERAKDDGVERQTVFVLDGALSSGRELPRIEVKASQFAGMSWTTAEWGARAVVNAGMGNKDHARAAIQLLSGDIPSRTTYTHLGWRQIGGAHYYLHAGGAIGATGAALPDDLHVDLEPKLELYTLPEAPTGAALIEAVKASLDYLELAPDYLTVPLLGSTYRAVIGGANYSIHLSGRTGAGKSVLCVLAQQHYGAGLDEANIPASWSSTANALEGAAFSAKDALLLVDDFKPEGSQNDVQRMHAAAARLFRSQGNRTGRGRMNADGTLRPDKPPRGLVLSTGEDVPTGHSIRARNILLDISPTDTNWKRVSEAQRQAAQGLYAASLTGFIGWLAEDYRARRERFSELHRLYREALQGSAHKRTSDSGAQLKAAWTMLLDFAEERSALSSAERSALWARVDVALTESLEAQQIAQEGGDPVSQFAELLTDALSSYRVHIADAEGQYPGPNFGWRTTRYTDSSGYPQERHDPQGDRIGWLEGNELRLIPNAAYAAVQDLARRQNSSIGVTKQTLWKRLDEAGLVARRDGKHLTVKTTLPDGSRTRTLCLRASIVWKSGASGASGAEQQETPSGTEEKTAPLLENTKTEVGHTGQKVGQKNTSPDAAPLLDTAAPLAKTEVGQKIELETPSGTHAAPLAPLAPLSNSTQTHSSKGKGGRALTPEVARLRKDWGSGNLKGLHLEISRGKTTSDLEHLAGYYLKKPVLKDSDYHELLEVARRYCETYPAAEVFN